MINKKNNKRKLKKLPKPSCPFHKDKSRINYKDVYKLKKFITTRGRLINPERTGVSPACQRKLSREVKRARYMALLPYNELT
jgi:small subunit ribosomal protein S18